MNILFLVPFDYEKIGGMYLPINHYLSQFKERGFKTELMFMPYHCINDRKKYKSLVLDKIRQEKPDAIMVYGLNQAFYVSKWVRKIPCKKYALLTDCLLLEVNSVLDSTKLGKHMISLLLRKILYKIKEKRCLFDYQYVTYVSKVDIDYVKKKYKKIKSTILYIPNGTDLYNESLCGNIDEGLKIGCLTGFSNETFENNLKPLVNEIFPLIKKNYPNTKLIVAGRGCSPKIKEYLEERNVVFLGYVERLEEFYDSIDVVVTTVKKECGIINRILEAWAFSKTVIGFKKNFATFAGAYDGVHYVSADTKQQFVNVIGKIYEEKIDVDEIGNNARKLVSADYTWEKCVNPLLESLNE